MSNGHENSRRPEGIARLPRVTTVVAQDNRSRSALLTTIGIVTIAVGLGIAGAFLSGIEAPSPNSRRASQPVAQDLGPVGESCATPARHVAPMSRGRDPFSQTELMILAEVTVTENFAQHVRCIITNDRPRFCSRPGRAALAAAVNDYLNTRRLAIRRLQQMGAAILTNPAHREAEATFQALAQRPGVPRMAPVAPSLDAVQEVDPGVILDIQNLIREGYVTASDFGGFLGFFMPEELAPHLEGLEVREKACG